MGEVDELGKSRDEGRNVCRCVEKWRVLLDKEVLHLPAPVLWCFVFGRAVLRVLYLRLVDELLFCSSVWINDWRQEGIGSVGHVESERLDVASYPGKRLDARRLCEG